MDKLEEHKPLFIQEANFRSILKRHILQLLKFKQEYWKKRYTIRWTKFGDESTNFFHAAATERYRQNIITSLEAQDGRVVYDHFEKAALLLENFKARMGQTTDPHMQYNLDELIELHAPTSSTQKLKLMRKGGQFTYTPTLPLTCRLPQAAYVDIGVGCDYFN
jgi:hypothetical protein